MNHAPNFQLSPDEPTFYGRVWCEECDDRVALDCYSTPGECPKCEHPVGEPDFERETTPW